MLSQGHQVAWSNVERYVLAHVLGGLSEDDLLKIKLIMDSSIQEEIDAKPRQV